MNQPDHSIMERETIVKEDGRTLIYYRFVPEPEIPVETQPAEARLV